MTAFWDHAPSDALLREKLQAADGFLNQGRRYGDLVVSAFFAADNDRKRKERLELLADDLAAQRSQYDVKRHNRLEAAVSDLRCERHSVVPFHWEIEFPEVFDRPNPGFDGFVGNPPFAGKNTLIKGNREGYLDWLKMIHEEAHGNADHVAHFFRRAFNLLGPHGCFGLIATNTIGQGDTRSTGLRWICMHGSTIYTARKRLKWPGQAAVVVSVVHVCRGSIPGQFVLSGREVAIITAYLFHAGGHDDPEKLKTNGGKSFIGSYVLGMGFTFDDTDTSGVSNPLSLMHELITKDPRNAERIFPYIGGEEVNDSPTHAHHRYVIKFGEMNEAEARRWPDLMRIVEEKVKLSRAHLTTNAIGRKRAANWWIYGSTAKDLYEAICGLECVLVNCQVGPHLGFALLPASSVFAHTLNQKQIHRLWR